MIIWLIFYQILKGNKLMKFNAVVSQMTKLITNIFVILIFISLSGCSDRDKIDLDSKKEFSTGEIINKLPAKGPYFPVDERVIEDRWMIERFVVPFEKHTNNPVVEKNMPWEGSGPLFGGTVIFDSQDNIFKMWYLVWDEYSYFNKLPYSYNICYAESKDGIEWEKPILGIFDKRGLLDKNNNFIKLGRQKTQDIDVEFNPAANSTDEKFIAIHNDSGGVFVSYSSDGKRFDCSFNKPAVPYHSDTHNNFVYDEVRNRWLMFVRPRAFAGDGLYHVNRRRIAVKESYDLKLWTKESIVLVPGEGDPTDFYGMTVFRQGDLFFGFLQIYDAGRSDKVFNELAWSPDGYRWNRLPLGTQNSPLTLGKKNRWDSGQIYLTDKPVLVGEEMWFYYGGNKASHNIPGKSAIGMAKTKLNRLFGARSLPDTIGRILTRPIKVNGDLYINAESKGTIQVEVRSVDNDEPIEGWSAEECEPFKGNELNASVSWGNKSLSHLNGTLVRLRFQLIDASLYSFDIR